MQMALYSTALIVIAFLLLVSPSTVVADQYIVGDIGWGTDGFDYNAWAVSNTFHTGDVLIFHYDPSSHNDVVATDANAFDNCITNPNLGVYSTANDELTLNEAGNYYFMCQYQCLPRDNMKMLVTVNN